MQHSYSHRQPIQRTTPLLRQDHQLSAFLTITSPPSTTLLLFFFFFCYQFLAIQALMPPFLCSTALGCAVRVVSGSMTVFWCKCVRLSACSASLQPSTPHWLSSRLRRHRTPRRPPCAPQSPQSLTRYPRCRLCLHTSFGVLRTNSLKKKPSHL